jgi:hypothetical protein
LRKKLPGCSKSLLVCAGVYWPTQSSTQNFLIADDASALGVCTNMKIVTAQISETRMQRKRTRKTEANMSRSIDLRCGNWNGTYASDGAGLIVDARAAVAGHSHGAIALLVRHCKNQIDRVQLLNTPAC